MKKRETYKEVQLMVLGLREFWLLLGAASFFATSTVALCIVIAYLLKG